MPTDRLKFDAQIAALRAFAIESGYGKEAVGAEQIAPRMGVSPATAGLNNAFFMETGLITRERKGHYKPTEAVNQFARDYGFDRDRARRHLAEPLKKSWPFLEIKRQLEMGPATEDEIITVLARHIGASAEHEVQLATVIGWLEYAEVITTANGTVEIIDDSTADADTITDADAEATEPEQTPADAEVSKPTTQTGRVMRPRGEPVLTFSFDLNVTAEDLKHLSPEQITALYEAVGKLVAIKASMEAQT